MKIDKLIKQMYVILDSIQDCIIDSETFRKWNKAQLMAWKIIMELEKLKNGF